MENNINIIAATESAAPASPELVIAFEAADIKGRISLFKGEFKFEVEDTSPGKEEKAECKISHEEAAAIMVLVLGEDSETFGGKCLVEDAYSVVDNSSNKELNAILAKKNLRPIP